MTKPNGHNSNLAQSSCVALDGPNLVTQPFNHFLFSILVSLLDQAQILAFLLLGHGLLCPTNKGSFFFYFWIPVVSFGGGSSLSVPGQQVPGVIGQICQSQLSGP
jgi:hypothetical protein